MLLITIILSIIPVWILICWTSLTIMGWKKWETKFRRKVIEPEDIAPSLQLRKFGGYNNCIRVGVETYGVAIQPTIILFFHHSFCIPWIYITSYEYIEGKVFQYCILRTPLGDIKIYGDVAELVARECEKNFVKKV